MKLLSFIANGREKYGLAVQDGIIDLQPFFPQHSDLRSFLSSIHQLDNRTFIGKKQTIVLMKSLFYLSLRILIK
jgi:hypothetical protein